MGDRDKIEPFWVRPSRARREGPPPLVVPERPGAEARTPQPRADQPAAPAEEPREPSFTISHEARRAAIAELMTDPPAPAADAPEGRQEPSLGAPPPEAAPEPDAQGWIRLSRAEAAQHRFYGTGGWLVLIELFVVLGLAMGVVEFIDYWATTDHGGLSAWIMTVLRALMLAWGVVVLVLLLAGSRAFPTAFVAYAMFNIIYLGLFGLAFAHVTHGKVFIGVAVAIPLNLLAMAYVLRSRRVNVTFRRRVRAKKRMNAPPPGAEPSPA